MLLACAVVLLPGCSSDLPSRLTASPDGDVVTTVDVSALIDRGIAEQLTLGPEIGVDYSGLRAVVVMVDGAVVFEKYYGASPQEAHDVQSVTTTVLSTLVGIAVGEGRLGLDDRLAALLPQYASSMSPQVARVTLRQILTMSAGFSQRLRRVRSGFERSPDWVGDIVASADTAPGRRFVYSDDGAHLVSAILERATGEPVLHYARTRLFDPLGIPTDPAYTSVLDVDRLDGYRRAGFAWPVDPQGHAVGHRWLRLRPMDLATLGQVYLDHGVWQGRRILPADWIRQATSNQSALPVRGPGPVRGYGFGWWIRSAADDPAFAALGYGGQLVEVVPTLRLVVVTAVDVAYDDETDRGVDVTVMASLTESVIAPAVRGRS